MFILLGSKILKMKYLILLTQLLLLLTLNPEINKAKKKMPSITNLATTATPIVVENKILNVSDLVKKADYHAEMKDIKNKYFSTSDYNKFTNIAIDAKNLFNESGLNEKIKTLAAKQ